jgi:hypothetical protein
VIDKHDGRPGKCQIMRRLFRELVIFILVGAALTMLTTFCIGTFKAWRDSHPENPFFVTEGLSPAPPGVQWVEPAPSYDSACPLNSASKLDMCHAINLDGSALHPEYWNPDKTPRSTPRSISWLDIAFESVLLGAYGAIGSIALWILHRMIRFAVKG